MTQQSTQNQHADDRNTKLERDYQSAGSTQSNEEAATGQKGANQSKLHGEVGGGAKDALHQNVSKKSGGKPRGDEGIPNRGVTQANPNKDKAI